MQNDAGERVDLYIPRKWYVLQDDLNQENRRPCQSKRELTHFLHYSFCSSSASNRLITAKDHAAVQINFANVDERGVYNGEVTTFAICGYLRQQARSDNSINRLAQEAGLIQVSHKF